jgi:hypothetical protein
MTKTKVQASVAEKVEAIVNDDPVSHKTWSIGDVAHQGDLIFVCIGARPARAKPRANRQLADGNTHGSRHILDRGEAFDADKSMVADAIRNATKANVDVKYIGPVFTGKGAHVDHPEHGPHTFEPNTCTAVVYQRSLDSEEREQRVLD